MRIVVDRDLCQGHGVCESEAPDVFSVSKKGVLTVVNDERVDRGEQPIQYVTSQLNAYAQGGANSGGAPAFLDFSNTN